jgi:hypothetical protein
MKPAIYLGCFLVLLLLACGGAVVEPTQRDAQPVLTRPNLDEPSPTPRTAANVAPQAAETTDSGWNFLQAGLERRRVERQSPDCGLTEEITIVRIDPGGYAFDVGYDPQGRALGDWLVSTGADIVVNGGYFQKGPDGFEPAGLIVAGGETFGQSYGDFAGMLAVGADGPELRWLREQPYDPAEPLQAALQSFPLLIKPGGELGFPAESDDGIRARRTVIGADRTGRFIILIASKGCFTLRALSVFLFESDLDLGIALNLDGGPSTGLAVADPAEEIPSGTALPIVLLLTGK